MKKPKIKMTVYCEKFGKIAPVEEKSSNENWRVFDMTKPCECGGKFIVKHEIIKD